MANINIDLQATSTPTSSIIPADTHEILISGLDSSYTGALALFYIQKRGGQASNILPSFDNGFLYSILPTIPEDGTYSQSLRLPQLAAFDPNTTYNGELQLIKTDGTLLSYFFNIQTLNNYVTLIESEAAETFDYKYLGAFAAAPEAANNKEIYLNTAESQFYIYFAELWQPAGNVVAPLENFDPLFLHDFTNLDNLTLDGSQVLSVVGTGSQTFDIDSTPVVGAQDYRGNLAELEAGTVGVKGGIYGGKNASLDLSNYPDFTYVGTFKWDYDGYDRPGFDALTQFTNDDGNSFTYRSTIQLGWTVQAGIFFDWDSTDPFGRNSIEDKNVHTLILTRNSGDIRIYVDGVLCRKGTVADLDATAIPASGISYGGLLQPEGVKAVGSDQMIQLEHSVYGRGITDAEAFQIDKLAQAKIVEYKSPANIATDLWLYIGNSIGAGFPYGDSSKTPAILTMKALDETYSKPQTRWHNLSQGGITTPEINADLDTHYKPFVSQTTGTCRFLVHEGTNHIEVGGAASGQEVYDALKEFSDAVKAEGVAKGVTVEVYIGTILPRTAFDAGEEVIRQAANTLIRNNAVTDGYILVDFETNPNLTNASNATYFSDGTHLTITGAEELASSWASVINNNI